MIIDFKDEHEIENLKVYITDLNISTCLQEVILIR